ncbi:hypothetical protein Tco_0022091 [Tanacetum coccineum]
MAVSQPNASLFDENTTQSHPMAVLQPNAPLWLRQPAKRTPRGDGDVMTTMLVMTLMEMWQRGWGCGDSGAALAGGGEEVEARGGGDRIDPGRI